MNYTDFVEATARAFPDRTAVRAGGDSRTYADLLDDVRSAANTLADAGVGPGDRVLLMLPNTYQFVTAALGVLARQAVLVPVDTRFEQREVTGLLRQVDPAAAVVSDSTKPVVDASAAAATNPPTTFVTGDGAGGDSAGGELHDWEQALADAGTAYAIPETLGDRDAVILHTSGSTGAPKAVCHTHANLIAVSDAAAVSYEMRPGDVFLAVMPLSHCTGLGTVLGPTLKVGGELLLYEGWEPERTLNAIAEHRVNVFSGVPTMYRDWLGKAGDGIDTSSMHTGVIGGAGVTAALVQESEALLGCPVLNGWGMTETFAGGLWEDRRGERRPPSVGRPSGRLFEAKIIDRETGAECPPGKPGELLVRGAAMMTGYLDHEAAWSGEWFHTGDYARRDDGFVTILDRADDTIVTGGENVFPQEIETVIEELPDVQEAVVIGKPDDRKGEKPVAFVRTVPESDLTERAVKERVLAELAAFKHPREVYFVDSLPRTAGGKTDREALAARL
ncbi:MAG: class I adenylate-forming enzyme family protein [Halolamina sp.]